ncbi:MAG: type VI secretion system tube protein TssD, partial [Enterobacter sp.]|uniref:type VI secretion system tube protein TssD n=1 Tax=Enterobacter sp. TaxID=42895 RepID=UPI0028FDE2BA
DKGWDARKRAYCLKIQPATGSFARNLIYSTKPAASTGQALKSAEIKFYHINDAGQEVCYYTVLMENVKVTGVNCSVPNVKIAANDKMNHVESVSLQYEKITWRIVDGNIMHSDAWNERPTA